MEEHKAAEDRPSLSGKRVVIIEDEAIILMQLRKAFRREGLLLVGDAANGKDGVEVVLRERPDFVISDIDLPLFNGFEVVQQILEVYRPCILFLTGHSDFEQRSIAAGVCGYVVKPVISEQLVPSLNKAYANFLQQKPG